LLDDLTIRFEDGMSARGGIYLQSYTLTTGKPIGTYNDGRIAAVDNAFGKGKTRLVGSFPGYGYNRSQDSDTKRFFANLLKWAGKDQHVTSTDSRIIARLHTDGSSRYLWIVNSDREDISTKLRLSARWGSYEKCRVITGQAEPTVRNRVITTDVPARTVLVLELL
jgi:beta-galactosidase